MSSGKFGFVFSEGCVSFARLARKLLPAKRPTAGSGADRGYQTVAKREVGGGSLRSRPARTYILAVWCWLLATLVVCLGAGVARAQTPDHLNATIHDPVYMTYAAPISRSEYFVDEGYHLNDYTPGRAVSYTTDTAGDFGIVWQLGKSVASDVSQFPAKPILRRSFTDIAQLDYRPFLSIRVRETLVVYSSRLAFVDVEITNESGKPAALVGNVWYQRPDPVTAAARVDGRMVTFGHVEPANLWFETPQPKYDPNFHDVLLMSVPAASAGGFANAGALDVIRSGAALGGKISGSIRGFVLRANLTVPAHGRRRVRIVRGVEPASQPMGALESAARALLAQPVAPLVAESRAQYRRAPHLKLPSREWQMVYWSALSLVRQQMMPPAGMAHHNYYVFSREPTWRWGHEGQVFHESLSMLAYVYMNPKSAEGSQRVFMGRQEPSGYIGYRVGPFVTQTYPVKGEQTTSAPFFSWTNWELYQISHDRKFLADSYRSGSAFADYILKTRDKDGDGFMVWGGNAMLECVRDSQDAVWHLFGDTDDSPSRVKALDFTTMMAMETRSLARMARALGRPADARRWQRQSDHLAALVRTRMWDPKTGFFYNLSRDTGTFTTGKGISLKRKEIIGFLPMWAGIATKAQAARLVQHLTNPKEFWRRFGVPTLSASDPYYQPQIKQCCQWNGAVWLLWNYLVFRGLLRYGYRSLAEELLHRDMAAVTLQLDRNHRFWESYSPDFTELHSPKNYIWDSILARMMIELYAPGRAAD
jgi:hypothetical protein